MYVDIVPNRKSRPAVLLREGWREGKKVCKRTVANLSDWPARKVELLRRVLRDEPLVSPTDAFAIERSLPHGHVEVVLETIRRIGLSPAGAGAPAGCSHCQPHAGWNGQSQRGPAAPAQPPTGSSPA